MCHFWLICVYRPSVAFVAVFEDFSSKSSLERGNYVIMRDMIIRSETDMLALGRQLAGQLTLPAVIELRGDVGVGKTTFTQGLAAGLGVTDPITSPSFTISKRYAFPLPNNSAASGELIHYDFYRLNDPGIMRDELAEALLLSNAVVVIEWGGDVADLLPADHFTLDLSLNADGTRTVELRAPDARITLGANLS